MSGSRRPPRLYGSSGDSLEDLCHRRSVDTLVDEVTQILGEGDVLGPCTSSQYLRVLCRDVPDLDDFGGHITRLHGIHARCMQPGLWQTPVIDRGIVMVPTAEVSRTRRQASI